MNPRITYLFLGALTIASWWGSLNDFAICTFFTILLTTLSLFLIVVETVNTWGKD